MPQPQNLASASRIGSRLGFPAGELVAAARECGAEIIDAPGGVPMLDEADVPRIIAYIKSSAALRREALIANPPEFARDFYAHFPKGEK